MTVILTSEAKLGGYVSRQLNNFFPSDGPAVQVGTVAVSKALTRVNSCLSRIKANSGKEFDYLNSGQYATFLYYLANCIWRDDNSVEVATKLFLLNKALNGIDLFYEVDMPEFFIIGHTVGMVFAKATYGNYCVFHQGCTIGRSGNDRPVLESGVLLYPNSSVIGRCLVRSNTVLAPGVQLVNQDTPGNCYVFTGKGGQPVFKSIDEYFVHRYFDLQSSSDCIL